MSHSDFADHSHDFVKDYLCKAKKATDGFSPNDTMLLSEILRIADSLDTMQYQIDMDPSNPILDLDQACRTGSLYDFRKDSPPCRNSNLDKLASAIMDEIYSALCKKDKRYQKESQELASNVHLLIGAVGGYVAANVGVAVAVVSAFTAVVLRLALAMGLNAFCTVWAQNRKDKDAEQSNSGDP